MTHGKCAKPASVGAEPASNVDLLGGGIDLTNSNILGSSQAPATRRQIAARHISHEPKRPRYADIERMCAELPYGYWRDADGRIVVFNRRYRPLWQRLSSGEIERADAGECIEFVEQRWFNWDDVCYAKGARDRLRKILKEFFDGKDLVPHTIRTEWDNDPPDVQQS